jgi:hypothetical protein
MSCPSQSSSLDHPNDIWWGVQSIKLLTDSFLKLILEHTKRTRSWPLSRNQMLRALPSEFAVRYWRERSWPSQLGCSAVKLPATVGGGAYRSCQEHQSVPFHNHSSGRYWLGVSFITCLKSNLCTALITDSSTEYNFIVSQEQNTTAVQPKVFLNWNASITGHGKGRPLSPA